MSDYRLDFGSVISANDTNRLYDLLSIVSKEDELEITITSDDPAQINSIIDMLKNNDFEVSGKGGDTEREYHIIAHRVR